MSKLVKNPNLPEGTVDTLIIGKHEKIIPLLNKEGIKTIVTDDNKNIDYSVRNHADMAACYLGSGKIIIDRRQASVISELEELGAEVICYNGEIKGEYPDDVPLNCAVFGHNLIYFPKGTATQIIDELSIFRQFSVKQGYCKCSVCPISDNAIITDDVGIYNKTKKHIDALLIEKGDILLEGKEYGFIGGSCGMIDKDVLLFFGDVSTHRNAEEIKMFLHRHNVKYRNLFSGKLTDIGGIIPITIK